METKRILSLVVFLLCGPLVMAQDDLLDLLGEEEPESRPVTAVFKGTRIVNGHSVKLRKAHELEFLISHRFGRINGGIVDFFGLDEANIRLALEYGITDNLNIGMGRSSFAKNYDTFVKWRFLSQKTGSGSPVSMVWFSNVSMTALIMDDENFMFDDRLSFTHELMIARKFSPEFSFQLMPGLVHVNAVPTPEDDNDIYFVGGSFRYKLTQSVALTFEYYYRFNQYSSMESFDPIGIGFDIETGGHVFQLHFTNARAIFEKAFITDTTDDFWDGDIRFGFNISRTFQTGSGRQGW